jgi:hypothetical protein
VTIAKDTILRTAGEDIPLATLKEMTDALGTVAFDRAPKVVKVALTAPASATNCFSWANPESVAILVTRLTLDITTQSTGACSVDFGYTATTSTTSSDTLIDGLSVATAGTYDNIENQGTNGKATAKMAVGKWITGTTSADATGLVGYAYIEYILI